jgi:GNAT superfamily N-acetyltransferase
VTDELVVRAASAADRLYILDLLARTLGWERTERSSELFAWKHDQNVFGASPAWVAWDGHRLSGFRTFLRWDFELNGETVRAVRAVDTATDAAVRRRGVFRRLTEQALDALRADGVAFVFNTPNEQSRPGYLRMGWEIAGRVPLAARPTGLGGIVRMARARVPAELWSASGAGGESAPSVLDATGSISELLQSQPRTGRMTTRRTLEYLRWRYGLPLLDYRAAVMPGGVAAGVAFFRVRRRGPAREAALCDVLVPGEDPSGARHLIREVTKCARADYVLRVPAPRDRGIPLPRQGPVITTRTIEGCAPAVPEGWALSLGDLELL